MESVLFANKDEYKNLYKYVKNEMKLKNNDDEYINFVKENYNDNKPKQIQFFYLANKIIKNKIFYKNNRQLLIKKATKYNAEHKDLKNSQARERYKNNPEYREKCKAYHYNYYHNNE